MAKKQKIDEPFQLSRILPRGKSNGKTARELWTRVKDLYGNNEDNKKSLKRQLARYKRQNMVHWVGQGSGTVYYT